MIDTTGRKPFSRVRLWLGLFCLAMVPHLAQAGVLSGSRTVLSIQVQKLTLEDIQPVPVVSPTDSAASVRLSLGALELQLAGFGASPALAEQTGESPLPELQIRPLSRHSKSLFTLSTHF